MSRIEQFAQHVAAITIPLDFIVPPSSVGDCYCPRCGGQYALAWRPIKTTNATRDRFECEKERFGARFNRRQIVVAVMNGNHRQRGDGMADAKW